MGFFPNVRLFNRAVVALEQIAASLVYFASADAQARNRLFNPNIRAKRPLFDHSELLHTDPAIVSQLRREEAELMQAQGYRALDDQDEEEWQKLMTSSPKTPR